MLNLPQSLRVAEEEYRKRGESKIEGFKDLGMGDAVISDVMHFPFAPDLSGANGEITNSFFILKKLSCGDLYNCA